MLAPSSCSLLQQSKPSFSTSHHATPSPPSLLLSQSPFSAVGPHLGIFYNTISREENSLSQQHRAAPLPTVPGSTTAIPALGDRGGDSLAAPRGARRRPPAHHPLSTSALDLRSWSDGCLPSLPFLSCHEIWSGIMQAAAKLNGLRIWLYQEIDLSC